MIDSVAKGLARWGFYWARRLHLPGADRGGERLAVIVRFHSVSGPAQRHHLYVAPNISVAPDVFDRQIAFLARQYRCVSMDVLAEALASGRRPAPSTAVVTFDDGYRDNFERAYPILRAHGVPAIFYLATGSIDGGEPMWPSLLRYLVYSSGARLTGPFPGGSLDVGTAPLKERAIRQLKAWMVALPGPERQAALRELQARVGADQDFLRAQMLSWKDVREMSAGGMLFGAHTVSHPLLPSIPLAEAADEIRTSKSVLEGALGRRVDHFSYPNPGSGVHCSPAVKAIVAEAGFATAVTSVEGYVDGHQDRLELPRVRIGLRATDVAWDIERLALQQALGSRRRPLRPVRQRA
jgi:peptidoglycan/xylan/chitin deacetylase (PgdA/CDA1 family)